MLANFCAVALGGALGAVGRYAIGLAVASAGAAGGLSWLCGFPLATFLANALGCFLIGMLSVLFDEGPGREQASWRLFAITGVMGGFTTFSTFSLETAALATDGAWGMAALNVTASLVACLAGVVAGRMAGAALFGIRA